MIVIIDAKNYLFVAMGKSIEKRQLAIAFVVEYNGFTRLFQIR